MKLYMPTMCLVVALGLTACQSKINPPKTLCVVNMEIVKKISRLNDEGDHMLWIERRANKEAEWGEYSYSESYFDAYYDKYYNGIKSAVAENQITLKEPQDFRNDHLVVHQNLLQSSVPVGLYRPDAYRHVKTIPLKELKTLGQENNCDLLATIHVKWIQSPEFKFLKKPKYHLGLQTDIRVFQVKDGRSASFYWKQLVEKPLEENDLNRPIESLLDSNDYTDVLNDFQTRSLAQLPDLIQTIGQD